MKIFQLFVTGLVVAGLASCIRVEDNSEPAATGEKTPATPASAMSLKAPVGGKLITLSVEGMSCQFNCAPKVQETLAGVEGVKEVEVDFATKKAVVAVQDEKFDATQLETALASTGSFTGKAQQ